ncbi:Yfh1 frataxin [Candida orthopsilosis Co 90-125]|uniref:ferroxidase n=1 Tax=Candida orthopsilosis (strain 90-125) TaxID=1136231 RepID=H8X7A4_CANO9|nr:Yfh1 frataxin [Candida orthopsilosis Co 90-125]CCG24033.1 Yfh1 frataxin [Candida orthopsilosis Co 90-125]
MFRRSVKSSQYILRQSLKKRLPTATRLMPLKISSIPMNATIGLKFYSISTQGEKLDGKIDQISDGEYNKLSNEYLENLSDELEELNGDYEQVDAELSHGVLTLTLPPNGTYVINKQPPNKQIWLSSPISGPKRYDLIQGQWRTLRDGSLLTELLEQEISEALKTDFKFESVSS